MNTQIITIGNEILNGTTVNTNSAYISKKLSQIGIDVNHISVIPDTDKIIFSEFRKAFSKNDIIIVTGGLGPTHDDITKFTISKFFHSDLIINKSVLYDIKLFFKKRGRILTETNRKQALVPEITKVIRNPLGTAPGLWIEKDGKIFIAMPGVPHEMRFMIDNYVIKNLKKIVRNYKGYFKIKEYLTTGIPESNLYDKIISIINSFSTLEVAFLPNQFGVKIRIKFSANTKADGERMISSFEKKLFTQVGDFIYSTDEKRIEDVIGELLKKNKYTISTAESCTGGLLGHRLTNVSGSSSYYLGGVISYSNKNKMDILKVNKNSIKKYGAVSEQVAKEMALGLINKFKTDIGISLTGIMGPTGGTKQKPVGLVFIALYFKGDITIKEVLFGDNRILNKDRASQFALDLLRRKLLNLPI
ncbi:MAG: competence/damage-inducible protein A [Ignavibacteriales bacterium]|nr:competence/damage-inducible protein A [Ignavibacteriales bacterium]